MYLGANVKHQEAKEVLRNTHINMMKNIWNGVLKNKHKFKTHNLYSGK